MNKYTLELNQTEFFTILNSLYKSREDKEFQDKQNQYVSKLLDKMDSSYFGGR